MIRYTERDTDLNFPPPYRITGVEALSAVKRIDVDAAQDWLDETLNWRPAGEEPQPRFDALPVAFVVFMKMESMRSIEPPHCDWGAVSESEMVVTLPVLEWDNDGFDPVPSLKFYPVVLCLDSGPALISGREVFGFPKIMGQIEIGPGGGIARCEACRAEGNPATQRNDLLLSLLRAREHDLPPPAPASFTAGLAEMIRDELLGGLDRGMLRHLLKLDPARMLLNFTLERLVGLIETLEIGQKFVFLKQFRDVERPELACHRSVAECVLEFSRLTRLEREGGDWQLEVPEWRSSALLKRLGLATGAIGAPLRSEFQFDLLLGKTLWSP